MFTDNNIRRDNKEWTDAWLRIFNIDFLINEGMYEQILFYIFLFIFSRGIVAQWSICT